MSPSRAAIRRPTAIPNPTLDPEGFVSQDLASMTPMERNQAWNDVHGQLQGLEEQKLQQQQHEQEAWSITIPALKTMLYEDMQQCRYCQSEWRW